MSCKLWLQIKLALPPAQTWYTSLLEPLPSIFSSWSVEGPAVLESKYFMTNVARNKLQQAFQPDDPFPFNLLICVRGLARHGLFHHSTPSTLCDGWPQARRYLVVQVLLAVSLISRRT